MFDRRTLNTALVIEPGNAWLDGKCDSFVLADEIEEMPLDEELLEEIESGVVSSSLDEARRAYRRFIELVVSRPQTFQLGMRLPAIDIFRRYIAREFGVTLEQLETSRSDLLRLVRILSKQNSC